MAKTAFAPPQVAETVERKPLPCTRRSGRYSPFRLLTQQEQQQALGTADAQKAANEQAPQNREPTHEELADAARERGYQDGVAIGVEEGREQGYNETAELRIVLEETLGEITTMRGVLTEAYRREMIELGLSAAEALVQRTLTEQRDVLEGLVTQALAALSTDSNLVLRVCTSDRESLNDWVEEHKDSGIVVQTDDSLKVGDFRLSGVEGTVESVMEHRLAHVRQLVLGQLAGKDEET